MFKTPRAMGFNSFSDACGRHLQRCLNPSLKAAAIFGWGLFASTTFIGLARDNFSDYFQARFSSLLLRSNSDCRKMTQMVPQYAPFAVP
ncbi:hypothetical protein SBA5_70119 [Candidatus Sulfotelmatomonas gaucii]|uniref:Uncharacterized protein n=1 Tax=Candidatus Sulfuritelmatomonas gaucii TaxID=2043161 RepID=A0A2N9M0M0_9BACT|nr:hypothetical protein SBA5_70119 [Candidatus Sulfotelmatomonas gaucii]